MQLVAKRIEAARRLINTAPARAHGSDFRFLLNTADLDTPSEKRLQVPFALARQFVRDRKRAGSRRTAACDVCDSRISSVGPRISTVGRRTRRARGDLVRIDEHVLVAQTDSRAARSAAARSIHVPPL